MDSRVKNALGLCSGVVMGVLMVVGGEEVMKLSVLVVCVVLGGGEWGKWWEGGERDG